MNVHASCITLMMKLQSGNESKQVLSTLSVLILGESFGLDNARLSNYL